MHLSGPAKALGFLAFACAWGGLATAESRPATCTKPELWLISTRGVDCRTTDDEVVPALDAWRCESSGWEPKSGSTLAELATSRSLTIFVHGNWITSSDAFAMGAPIRDALAPHRDGAPSAVVIWSWPSEQDSRRRLADIREKAQRAEAQGRILARALDEVHSKPRVSLVGYSYGARLIASALHVRGTRRALSVGPRLSAVFMAAAVDDDGLCPNGCHGAATQQIERLLLLVNPCDPVLARYHFLYGRRSTAEALGAVGMSTSRVPESATITQRDVSGLVGGSHELDRYIGSGALMSGVRKFLTAEN